MSLQAKLIALLALVLAFAGLGLWGQQQHLAAVKAKAEVEALNVQVASLQEANKRMLKDGEVKDAVNLAKQRTINQLAIEAAQRQQELNEALKANRAWADALVPDGVWDALAPAGTGGKAKAGSGVDRAGPGAGPAGQGQRSSRAVGQGPP